MEWVFSVVSGLVSGIMASVIMLLVLFKIKPKIRISDEISVSTSDKTYRVKVVNESRFDLLDVKYTMHYCSRRGDGIIDFREVPPMKTPIVSISKYDKANADAPYALRISYDLHEYCPLNNDSYFEFTIRARHALSNSVTLCTQRYQKDKFIEGQFETKRSMVILRAS